MNIFDIFPVLNGYKTYIAGIGLVGLAIYQASTEHYLDAAQTFFAALGLFGVRHAISKGAGS